MRFLRFLYCTICLLVPVVSLVSQDQHNVHPPTQECPALVLQNNGFVTDTIQLLADSSQQVTGLCGKSQLILETQDEVTGINLRVYRHLANDVVRILFNGAKANQPPQGVITPCTLQGVCDASSGISDTLQSTFIRMTDKINDFFVNGYLYGRKIYVAGYKDGGLSVLLSIRLYNKYSILPTTLLELDGSSDVWDKYFVSNALTPFFLKSGIQGRWWSIIINYDPQTASSSSPLHNFLRGTTPFPMGADPKTIKVLSGLAPPVTGDDVHSSVRCGINATQLPNPSAVDSLENYRYVLHGESCIIF